jgi:photosystem II protein PsbQ
MQVMAKYRSFVVLFVTFVAVLVIGFTSPAEAKVRSKTPTYTAEQIAEIQSYAGEVAAMRDRMSELQSLIQAEDWTFTRNFIHGPLGELRVKMSAVARDLFPEAQQKARQAAKQISEGLNDIDGAAKAKNYKAAIRNYGIVMKGFEEFFTLIPQG